MLDVPPQEFPMSERARIRADLCQCDDPRPHFVPPSLGEKGFYACLASGSEKSFEESVKLARLKLEEISDLYERVVASGVNAPGTIAFQLKIDHLRASGAPECPRCGLPMLLGDPGSHGRAMIAKESGVRLTGGRMYRCADPKCSGSEK
jgi:hypothetical protein